MTDWIEQTITIMALTLFVAINIMLQDLTFCQWCWWIFKSTGMLCCVVGWILPVFWGLWCLHFKG